MSRTVKGQYMPIAINAYNTGDLLLQLSQTLQGVGYFNNFDTLCDPGWIYSLWYNWIVNEWSVPNYDCIGTDSGSCGGYYREFLDGDPTLLFHEWFPEQHTEKIIRYNTFRSVQLELLPFSESDIDHAYMTLSFPAGDEMRLLDVTIEYSVVPGDQVPPQEELPPGHWYEYICDNYYHKSVTTTVIQTEDIVCKLALFGMARDNSESPAIHLKPRLLTSSPNVLGSVVKPNSQVIFDASDVLKLAKTNCKQYNSFAITVIPEFDYVVDPTQVETDESMMREIMKATVQWPENLWQRTTSGGVEYKALTGTYRRKHLKYPAANLPGTIYAKFKDTVTLPEYYHQLYEFQPKNP